MSPGDLVVINDPLSFYSPDWKGAYAIYLGEISTRTMYNERRKIYAFLFDGEVKMLSLGFYNSVEVVHAIK